MKRYPLSSIIAALLLAAFHVSSVQATGHLVVYCSTANNMCEAETKAFAEKYGIKTSFIRNGSGNILAKIDAEKRTPQADVWYGGTLDAHIQAKEMGLLQPYHSPNLAQIMPNLRERTEATGNYSSSIYMGILGFGVNTQRLKQLGLPMPKCWADLANPVYKNEVQIADPQGSGTAYTALATFIELWGEDKAFEYLKQLNSNVSQYAKSGVAPTYNTARGETTIGIGFLHDYATEKEKNAPIESVIPCEKTGYEIGSVSIIQGARNLDNAKLFVDWSLSKEAQELAWKQTQAYQIVTNVTAESSPLTLKLEDVKLINYDVDAYGQKEMRARLLNKWISEVKMKK